MSDWDSKRIATENEENEIAVAPVVVLPTKGAWDDEDAEEDEIKSSWEDSDDAAEKPASPAPVVAPPKKKGTLSQKLAEKKEEEIRKKAERAAKLAAAGSEEEEDDYETAEERKARLAKAVIDSDLQNARDLFGDLAISSSSDGTTTVQTSKMESLDPTSRPDFDEYVQECMNKFSKFETKTNYSYFVESLIRSLMIPVSVDDSRRISSSITAVISEKQKAQKAAVGGKKGAKAKKAMLGKSAGGDRGVDTTNYNDTYEYDEFDDFM